MTNPLLKINFIINRIPVSFIVHFFKSKLEDNFFIYHSTLITNYKTSSFVVSTFLDHLYFSLSLKL